MGGQHYHLEAADQDPAFAFATIALVNLILIADLVVSLLVFLCVILTILDIVGGLYFMGLTIEIVTSVQLILSVGLALDYSAHIGVTYIVTRGRDRRQRTQDTLNNIGTAVFNGGFSTFLAFVLVAFSDSYVFLTFFKVKVFSPTQCIPFICILYNQSAGVLKNQVYFPIFGEV